MAFRAERVFKKPVFVDKFLGVVSECISAYGLDRRLFLKGPLLSCGIKFDEKPNEIVGKFKDKVSFIFDELNRPTNVSAKL